MSISSLSLHTNRHGIILCSHSVMYSYMSLTEHQNLARGIFHDIFDYWIDLLHIASHTHRSVSYKDQIYCLLFCFAHYGCSSMACLQYAFTNVGSIPDSALLGY